MTENTITFICIFRCGFSFIFSYVIVWRWLLSQILNNDYPLIYCEIEVKFEALWIPQHITMKIRLLPSSIKLFSLLLLCLHQLLSLHILQPLVVQMNVGCWVCVLIVKWNFHFPSNASDNIRLLEQIQSKIKKKERRKMKTRLLSSRVLYGMWNAWHISHLNRARFFTWCSIQLVQQFCVFVRFDSNKKGTISHSVICVACCFVIWDIFSSCSFFGSFFSLV